MKYKLLFLLGIIFSLSIKGQTIIGIQDFEVVPATPTMTYTGGTIATGNGLFPNAPKFVSGARGLEVNNAATNIIFSTVNASTFTSVFFTCRLASFAGTSGNGADGPDFVIVHVSTDGGATWSQELQINGNNNARWSFTSGTGTASTLYDGNNVTTSFAPAGGGARTTDGYSTITVTGLPSSSNLRIKLEVVNNDVNEFWVIDDAEIRGTPSVPCVAPVSQPTGLTLSNITFFSIDGAFTATTADSYLIVQSTSSTLSGNPVNGINYVVGDPIGGGTVISVGSATTFTTSGLNASTTYYFFIFAFNNPSCTFGPSYNTTNPLQNNATTIAAPPFSIAVIISEYTNETNNVDEWTELVVVQDNVDMRNWTFRDNNSSTNSWQTALVFTNIALWNNMRGGTIIKIWHNSSVATDVNKDDGYIEIGAKNTTYFSGGSGSTLDIANSGDILQLRDASSTHIHALAHDASPGTSWTTDLSGVIPKVLRQNNFGGAGESVRVVGNLITNYNGGATTNNTIVTIGSTGITDGLANDANNQQLWNLWREPLMTTQTVTATICGSGCVDFTFNAATDPVPADQTQGYIILRKPLAGTFSPPLDGTTYVIGATLGGATVVDNIDNLGTATVFYTDATAPNGTFEYRVYAYRYTTDNINGNTFAQERGRAYNTTNFVTATLSTPLPITLTSFTGKELTSTSNLLEWTTSSEINNDFFTLERSNDAINFEPIATIKGAGNSNQILNYEFIDQLQTSNLKLPTVYYRLKQTDFDGQFEYFDVIAITRKKTTEIKAFYFDKQLVIQSTNPKEIPTIKIIDVTGRAVYEATDKNTTINLTFLAKGIYIYQISYQKEVISDKFVVE